MEQNSNNALSINRFKDRDISTLTEEEYKDYVLGTLMQKTIQVLEGAINSDRQFSRARFEVFSAFHEARDKFVTRKGDK